MTLERGESWAPRVVVNRDEDRERERKEEFCKTLKQAKACVLLL